MDSKALRRSAAILTVVCLLTLDGLLCEDGDEFTELLRWEDCVNL